MSGLVMSSKFAMTGPDHYIFTYGLSYINTFSVQLSLTCKNKFDHLCS